MLVVSRDVIVVAGSLGLHYLNGEVHVHPRWSGKIATVFQMIAIGWVTASTALSSPDDPRALAGVFTLISWGGYMLDGIRQLGHSAHEHVPRLGSPMNNYRSTVATVVAIVGRPNVGKSALFNRLAGRQISIVHDQPGITRDRLVAECKLARGLPFEIIDTGGIGMDVDGSSPPASTPRPKSR